MQDFALKRAFDRELRMESLGLGGVAPTPKKNPFSPHQSSNPPQILALLASGECFA
jgi:hypothetical protein